MWLKKYTSHWTEQNYSPRCSLKLEWARFSKFRTIIFAKNYVCRYLFKLNSLSSNNSGSGILESQQTSYKITKDFLIESLYDLTDVALPSSEDSNLSANLNETSISFGQPVKSLPTSILIQFEINLTY